MRKSILLLFIISSLLLTTPAVCQATTGVLQSVSTSENAQFEGFSKDLINNEQKIIALSKTGRFLVVDIGPKNIKVLKMYDSALNKIMWSVKLGKIYDVQYIDFPTPKVVVITKEKEYMKKVSINLSGKIIKQDRFFHRLNVPLGDFSLKWFPATKTKKEYLVIQQKNTFKLYKYPWLKPSLSYSPKLKAREGAYNVLNWQIDYPYLVVKYEDGAAILSAFGLKVINLYTNKETIIKPFQYTRSYFNAEKNSKRLYITTLASTSPQPWPPDLKIPQTFYYSFDIQNGEEIFKCQKKFTYGDDVNIGGWEATFDGNAIVKDIASNKWDLYNIDGKRLFWEQEGFPNARFISIVRRVDRYKAYFLVLDTSLNRTFIKVVDANLSNSFLKK